MSKAKYSSEDIVCIVTGFPGATLHHIKSQGSGGDDEDYNLMPLCHRLHLLVHQIGLRALADNHEEVARWLKKNKWEYSYVFKKWTHND